MRLLELVQNLRKEGFNQNLARVKVCQELFLYKLSKSKYNKVLIIKGGIVMYQLSKELRRATEDIDIDVDKISLENRYLFDVLNDIGRLKDSSHITFKVLEDEIKSLKHEAYNGKRVCLQFKDQDDNYLKLKLDIGVHTLYQIKQNHIVFDLISTDKGIKCLANPIEQMIVEKTSSFIRFGFLSTRLKDLYDIFFLVTSHEISKSLIVDIINMIFIKTKKVESLNEYTEKLITVLSDDILAKKMTKGDNWTEYNHAFIISILILFFKSLNHHLK